MTDLDFDFEWVDPQGARGPELRATWARVSIKVGDEVVTRAVDRETRAVRSSIYTPLYPIAEWIVLNWWSLLYEVDAPQRSTRDGYRSRHVLSTASEGFTLPPLLFDPMGEVYRLSWSPMRFRHSRVEFVSDGVDHLDPEGVKEALRRFVQVVVLRLEDEGVGDTLLQSEWSQLDVLDSEEAIFCRLAASLGLDPFDTTLEQQRSIEEAAERVPPELQEEFFYSADPASLLSEAAGVQKALKVASANRGALEALCSLRRSFSSRLSQMTDRGMAPWREGYVAARALRERLAMDGQPLKDLPTIAEALGVAGDELQQVIEVGSGLFRIDGVVGFNERQSPGFVVRSAVEEAGRFTFCRELFEYLSAPNGSPLIVTKARTERQKRNRAFAAEFLLPSESLRSRVDSDRVSTETVDEIASAFGVSWAVVMHQMENHGIARLSSD
jgi:Zn-dependent peptidase ImmA (M78 family)